MPAKSQSFVISIIVFVTLFGTIWLVKTMLSHQPPEQESAAGIERSNGESRRDLTPPADSGRQEGPELTREPVEPTLTDARGQKAALMVRVLLETNKNPVAGVSITPRFKDADVLVDPEAPLVSDQNGCINIELTRGTVLERIFVRAGSQTTGLYEYMSLHIPSGEKTELALKVTRGGTFRGQVVDQEGHPIAGAEVLGWCRDRSRVDRIFGADPDRSARADEKGNFMLDHLGVEFVLEAQAPGLVCLRRLHGKLQPGQQAAGLELVLGPASVIRGRVLDPNLKPLAGVEVKVWKGGSWSSGSHCKTDVPGILKGFQRDRRTATAADGSFECGDLAPTSYVVTVEAPGYPKWERRHKPEDDSRPPSGIQPPSEIPSHWPEELKNNYRDRMQSRTGEGFLEIVLENGDLLRGSISSSTGNPVTGAEVRLHEIAGNDRHRTMTDDQGLFVFAGLSSGRSWRLFAGAVGHAIHVKEPIPLDEADSLFIEVVLEEAQTIAGRVLDEQGRPVYNSFVIIEGEREVEYRARFFNRPTWERSFDLHATYTDRDGRFHFGRLYPGTFLVTARDPVDENSSMELHVQAGEGNVIITFNHEVMRKVVLIGKVIDALSKEPVSTFSITPMRPDPDGESMFGSSHSFEDAEGCFELAGLDPGPIEIEVSAAGYAPWKMPLEEYQLGEHRFDVKLAPARKLHVKISDLQGQAIKGSLSFSDPIGNPIMTEQGGYRSTHTHLSDGEAVVLGLPASPVKMTVQVNEQKRQWDFDIDLTIEPKARFDFVIDCDRPIEWRRLHLFVLNAGDKTQSLRLKPLSIDSILQNLDFLKPEETDETVIYDDLLSRYFESLNTPIIKDVSAITAVASDGEGSVYSAGNCTRNEDGTWTLSSQKGGNSDSQPHSARPGLSLHVPRRAFQLDVSAPGYETLQLTVPAATDNENRDTFAIFLRRR